MKVYLTLLDNYLLLTKIIFRPGCEVNFYFKWSDAYRFIFKTFFICTISLYFICERILLDEKMNRVQAKSQLSYTMMESRFPPNHREVALGTHYSMHSAVWTKDNEDFLHSHFESHSGPQVTFSSAIHF